ncbi:MAG: hypothetical protein IPJ88_11830 [Myxococcales bacterium]|nr:MAG: hypothetical protein IPJ88_11830 [Myxococcales bacterium]
MYKSLCCLFVVSLLAGCDENVLSEFPVGLEPLEENLAGVPAELDGDPFPETLNMISGSKDGYDWVHARGFVHAPVAEVYAALSTPLASVDRREVDRWEIVEEQPESELYDFVYTVKNTKNALITVHYDVQWRHGVVERTDDGEPDITATRYQKIWGTSYIDLLEGSVLAYGRDETLTELEFVHHLDATRAGVSQIKSFIGDYYADVLAIVRDTPMPEF